MSAVSCSEKLANGDEVWMAFFIPVGYQKLRVWNYRFGGLEGDCVVFQVSIANATHTVADTGPNMDPGCDHRGRD